MLHSGQHSLKHSHVEVVLKVTKVFPDHLLAQALPGEEELCHCLWGVLEEAAAN